jgi:DNA-binding GntR family transcriptional regulator
MRAIMPAPTMPTRSIERARLLRRPTPWRARPCNNALLANYRGVINQLDQYRRATIARGLENIPLSTQEHEAIVDAVAARDERRAEALLTEHVLASRARLHAALGTVAAGP